MAPTRSRHRPSQLNSRELEELALAYVARFATTRTKLVAYLSRKIRQSGWSEEREPDLDGLAERLAGLGYIDERAFALSKSRLLVQRGYGRRRLENDLKIAGISGGAAEVARTHSESKALEAALRFAKKRKIGPFASAPHDRLQREKAIAAMVRAGHSVGLALRISGLAPGTPIDSAEIVENWDDIS